MRESLRAPHQSLFQKIFDGLIIRSWWVLLILAVSYLLYSHGIHKKQEAYREILARLHHLEKDKEQALDEREDLLLQANSQEDQASIELMLMKKLGVVPEGQKKVYFQRQQ